MHDGDLATITAHHVVVHPPALPSLAPPRRIGAA
jgi:hypothetical protein